jgi:branched-chain amino acid aminotransferase
MEIKITRNTNPAPKPDEDNLGFGTIFTDHMFIMNYDEMEGWHDARIVPYGPITLSPAANIFHYGSGVFEGLKAYRRKDGGIQLFRPEQNAMRMFESAKRMGMPPVPKEIFIDAVRALVDIDRDWVPHSEGASLYIRPYIIGTDPTLHVDGVREELFMVMLSPSGSYYKGGLTPVRIMLETEDVRTVRGGTGFCKCGGNYAASNRAGRRAEELGFSQVLWLDGVQRKYVEEVGAMNVMFKISGKVVTPMLYGTILPGVTRDSVIKLLKDMGYPVEERLLSMDELAEACDNGTLEEAWGTGTAAVVSPIGELRYHGKSYIINNNQIGELSQKLYDELTGIQWGDRPDRFGWTMKL